jgi:hypothetical protein
MAAAQLQHDHKHWLVIWGCYTRSYIAFPLFHAPRGTILTASAPGDMVTKMRREERSAGVRVPAPAPAPAPTPDWPGAADPQGAPGPQGAHGPQGTPGWQGTAGWPRPPEQQDPQGW